MKPMKNLVHMGLLAGWVLVGVVFTIQRLAVPGELLTGALAAVTYWSWLVGLAAVTSVLLARFEGPLAAVAVHLGTLAVLAVLPRVFPLTLVRYGLDVLGRI